MPDGLARMLIDLALTSSYLVGAGVVLWALAAIEQRLQR